MYEAVVDQIESAILTGDLVTGDRLPSERTLMAQLGTSRGTVREALRVLESRGIIATRQGDPAGPVVMSGFDRGVSSMLNSLIRAEKLSLGDVIQFRMVIEGACAELAASRPNDTLGPLRDAFEEIVASSDLDSMHRADRLFHQREAEASGNPLLALLVVALRAPIAEFSKGLDHLPFPAAHERAVTCHGYILDAILTGDGSLACELSRQFLIETYSPAVSDEDRLRLKANLGMAGHS